MRNLLLDSTHEVFNDIMSRTIRAALVTTVALLLAGCGGGGSMHAVPTDQSSGGTRSPQYVPPSTPVLYVASNDRIEAFNLTDAGSTPPSRTIFVHPNQTAVNVAITAFIDGTLDDAQTYYPAAGPIPSCRIVVESTTANGDAIALTPNRNCLTTPGDAAQALGIATNTVNSGIDLLFQDTSSGTTFIQRFSQSFNGGGTLTPTTSTTGIPTGTRYLASDRGGHDWISDTAGHIARLRHDASGVYSPVFTTTTACGCSGDLAVSPVDLSLYVIEPGAAAGSDRVARYSSATWMAANGGTLPSTADSQKVFVSTAHPSALAIDKNGNVYVGVTTVNGARVKVYNPTLTTEMRNLQALPGDGATKVNSIAIYQP